MVSEKERAIIAIIINIEVCFYYISTVLIAFNLHKNLEVETVVHPVS